MDPIKALDGRPLTKEEMDRIANGLKEAIEEQRKREEEEQKKRYTCRWCGGPCRSMSGLIGGYDPNRCCMTCGRVQ